MNFVKRLYLLPAALYRSDFDFVLLCHMHFKRCIYLGEKTFLVVTRRHTKIMLSKTGELLRLSEISCGFH